MSADITRTDTDAPAPDQGDGRSVVSGEPVAERERQPETPAGGGAVLRRWLAETALVVLIALPTAWAVSRWVVQPFEIPSTSMEQTLLPGDRVLVAKSWYALQQPERGEIVVFVSPEDGSTDLIKRVIALGGQQVDIRDGAVYVDGRTGDEPYVNPAYPDSYTSDGTVTVPPGHVWVMGDNRASSKDSRVFGPVPLGAIRGRAFAIYWPPTRMGGL